jgi:hypothetical protein
MRSLWENHLPGVLQYRISVLLLVIASALQHPETDPAIISPIKPCTLLALLQHNLFITYF